MHPIASHQVAILRMQELRREADDSRTARHVRRTQRTWFGLRRPQVTAPAGVRPA